MTTKISCKVETLYMKGESGTDPKVCAVLIPSVWDLLRMLWYKVIGNTTIFYYEFSEAELQRVHDTIKHWYLVKHLRGYKRRAK